MASASPTGPLTADMDAEAGTRCCEAAVATDVNEPSVQALPFERRAMVVCRSPGGAGGKNGRFVARSCLTRAAKASE